MWRRPGRTRAESNYTVAKSINIANTVDRYGFFEAQLNGGTYLSFDQTIEGVRVQSICTNFNGTPDHGSYIKINGTVVASDHTQAPDGTLNNYDSLNRGAATGTSNGIRGNQYGVGFWMQRGHTVVILDNHGSIQSTNCYDTWGNSSLCDTIASVLQATPAKWIVAIGTYDACSLNQNLRDALTNYFNDTDFTNTWISQRQSQMFLGKRNGIT